MEKISKKQRSSIDGEGSDRIVEKIEEYVKKMEIEWKKNLHVRLYKFWKTMLKDTRNDHGIFIYSIFIYIFANRIDHLL